MSLGVVVPCYRQEAHLPRTLGAIEAALAGHPWHGVLVIAEVQSAAPPAVGPRWVVLTPPAGTVPTPGASRMLGMAAVPGDWILFVDADTEVDAGWLARALEARDGDGAVAGFGGRLRERILEGGRERAGVEDMHRVGDAEGPVDCLTTPALYRRSALVAVGGYDARLHADEDFELGLRFAQAGWRLESLRGPAATHWSGPPASVAEIRRRWRQGLTLGPGEALRLYLGRRGFGTLLWRQRLPLAVFALGLALPITLLGALAFDEPTAFVLWLALALVAFAAVARRKHSLTRAAVTLAILAANGLGVLVGFARGPRAAAPWVTERA